MRSNTGVLTIEAADVEPEAAPALSAVRSGVDVRLLTYFVTVAEELHFRRAAARLYMAQPPLTRAIKSLEAKLGVQLFRRGAEGVQLTHAGTALLEESRMVLGSHRQLLERMEELRGGGRPRLRIGYAGAATGVWPAALVRRMRATRSDIAVELVDIGIAADAGMLERGAVDVALLSTPLEISDGLAHLVLARSAVLLVVARTAGPVADRRVRLRGAARDWPVAGDGGSQDDLLVAGYDEALEAVAAGEGSLLTTGFAAQRHPRPDVAHLERGDLEPALVYLAWRAADSAGPTAACCRAAADLIEVRISR